jgi:hypothetical protein
MISDEILGFIQHSLRLCQARSRAPCRGDDPALVVQLRHELEIRKYCLLNQHKADGFKGAAAVWWDYMTAHAHLQAARYKGEITETAFLTQCKALGTGAI